MGEPIRVKCPSCNKTLKAPSTARGRKVECSGCGTNFKIAGAAIVKAVKPKKSGPIVPSAARPAPKPTPRPRPTRSKPARKPRKVDDVEVLDNVEMVDDIEVIDDIEVMDSPRRKRRSNTNKPKKKRRSPGVVEDFEVIDDFDDLDVVDDDWGDDDLAGVGSHGPAVRRPPRKKKKKSSRAYGSGNEPPRSNYSSGGDGLPVFPIIGGLCFIFGAVDLVAYHLADTDITGVSWSPYVAFILGSILMRLGGDE